MTDPQPAELQALFASAKCVFFDFDGPVCKLFHGHRADTIAASLTRELIAGGGDPTLVSADGVKDDPLAILVAVADAGLGDELIERLERRLGEEEIAAAASAEPTAGAGLLIRRLDRAGYRLAVTTNNSAGAVRHYLRKEGLARHFGTHIHGRAPAAPRLLKPHPDCLVRALESTGWAAADALMIGDSPADLRAASALGMPFIGYASDDGKLEALGAGAGAEVIVRRLATLTDALNVASADQR
ncbi:HAD family hydrolase [Streptomyces sp. NPDC087901]|uniref:HAD family hydrolase n=1 Tax=Streptomyces sp. NPDC087901 TaxID=3365818 RepID=UPI00381C7DD8